MYSSELREIIEYHEAEYGEMPVFVQIINPDGNSKIYSCGVLVEHEQSNGKRQMLLIVKIPQEEHSKANFMGEEC